jgi:hypothetical protein
MHPLFIFPAALHHRASSNQTNNNHNNNNNFSDSIYNTKTPTTDLDSSSSYRSFASQQTAPTKPHPPHTTFRTTTLPLLGFEPASVCYYIAF